MGIRRIRNTLIIFMMSMTTLLGMQVYVQPKDPSFIEKIIDGFLAAGPTLILAFFSIRSERKKEEKNDEKNRNQAKENLEKEWYNQIVLDKLLDPLSEYFDYLEDNLNTTDDDILKVVKNMRIHCLRKLSILRIFDERLHKECLNLLLESNDNATSDYSIRKKRMINRKLKNELYQRMYKYIKE